MYIYIKTINIDSIRNKITHKNFIKEFLFKVKNILTSNINYIY